MKLNRCWPVLCAVPLLSFSLAAHNLAAQDMAVTCKPVAQRTGETGCWVLASQAWKKDSSGPVYWSLDRFEDRAAADGARGAHGQVFEALGKVWVFTIGAKDDRPAAGEHVTQIGPLPVDAHSTYMAMFAEAVFTPGMQSVVHRHPGAEAFYTEEGESCLETPAGKQVGHKGVDVLIPEGPPMVVRATGTENRRGLVLVLHDSTQPWSSLAPDWKPAGLCK